MIRTRGRESSPFLGAREGNMDFGTRSPKPGCSSDHAKEVRDDRSSSFQSAEKIKFLTPFYFESGSEAKVKQSALRNLATRLISAQEEERRRIARELHDDLSQEIALLSIHLEQLSKTIDGPESIKQCCLNLQDHVREISKNIYHLAYNLHPSKLEHFGLTAALNGLCQQFSVAGGLQVTFEQAGSASDLPKDVTLCIFRVAQEALRNCAKHSSSKTALVYLSVTERRVKLSIIDHGRGFEMSPGTVERGLGFTSMRERVMVTGGHLSVHSEPNSGTQVEATIPLLSVNVETGFFN